MTLQATMKKLRITTAFFLIMFGTYGQVKDVCICPKSDLASTTADSIFTLSNNKKIALCGYRNLESLPVTFSEFVLAECNGKYILDSWDATQICRIEVQKDTLMVNELYILPTGKKFDPVEIVWSTEKIYFSNDRPIKKRFINRQIRKYSEKEILEVLSLYETKISTIEFDKMQIARKLFVATISGSNKARQYFLNFPEKCGILDGAYKEEYRELISMLQLWDEL